MSLVNSPRVQMNGHFAMAAVDSVASVIGVGLTFGAHIFTPETDTPAKWAGRLTTLFLAFATAKCANTAIQHWREARTIQSQATSPSFTGR